MDGRARTSEFQFHGGLAFKTHPLAQAHERCHGIEEPARAGGHGAIAGPAKHLAQ